MWRCAKCGESNEDQFDSCWQCTTAKGWAEAPPPLEKKPTHRQKRVEYQMFRGVFDTWESLFTEAAEFATRLGPDRLISISHSEDKDDGVVTVWYWSDDPKKD